MAGCSITLLRADDEMLSLWDDPVLTPALRWGHLTDAGRRQTCAGVAGRPAAGLRRRTGSGSRSSIRPSAMPTTAAIWSAASRPCKAELAASAPADIRGILQAAATVLIRTVGGASGPLYGTFFLRAGAACAGKTGTGARRCGRVVPGRASKASDSAARRSRATRPCSMRCCRRCEAMRKALEDGGGSGEILEQGRGGGRSRHAGDDSDAGAQRAAPAIWARAASAIQDPGATSAWLLIKTAADTWRA